MNLSPTDVTVALIIGTLGVAFIGFMIWAIRRDNRPRDWLTGKRLNPGDDPSCPDCGRDPHTKTCRFAWMGPPPKDFVFIKPDDDPKEDAR